MITMRDALKFKLVVLIFGLVLNVGGFVWLCVLDWRIAVAIFAMMWGENIVKRHVDAQEAK